MQQQQLHEALLDDVLREYNLKRYPVNTTSNHLHYNNLPNSCLSPPPTILGHPTFVVSSHSPTSINSGSSNNNNNNNGFSIIAQSPSTENTTRLLEPQQYYTKYSLSCNNNENNNTLTTTATIEPLQDIKINPTRNIICRPIVKFSADSDNRTFKTFNNNSHSNNANTTTSRQIHRNTSTNNRPIMIGNAASADTSTALPEVFASPSSLLITSNGALKDAATTNVTRVSNATVTNTNNTSSKEGGGSAGSARAKALPKKAKTSTAKQAEYPCDKCSKVFTRKHNLKAHLLVHSGQRKFKCEYCGAGFIRKGDCKRHLIKVHSLNPLDPTVDQYITTRTRQD